MSVTVELPALAERLEEFELVAYLVSVDGDGRPHVVAGDPPSPSCVAVPTEPSGTAR